MHILYFHQYFHTPRSAGGTRSYELARRLVERDHTVTIVCVREGKDTGELPGHNGEYIRKGVIDGIQIIQFNLEYSNHQSVWQRAWVFFRYAISSSKLALRADYDLLFATSTPLTAAIPGILARLLKRKCFVFEVRDLWPELPIAMGILRNPVLSASLNILEWLAYRTANSCIALSPGIKKGIARRSPKKLQIAMIPNGSDLKLFNPKQSGDLQIPGVNSQDFVAVFTGAHGIANGLNAVLDAAKVLLEKRRIDIKLVFIGDGRLKSDLVDRADSENLINCVFLDPVPKNQLNQIVNKCDVGLMILANVPAFYYGTSPNKFFDYISSGLPVINNYPGWLADLIEKYKCGLVVPPCDPVAFAEALCKLADDKKTCKEYGRNSRYLAEKQFSRKKLANQFVDWLEKSWQKAYIKTN